MCAQCRRGCCKYTAEGMLNQLSMLDTLFAIARIFFHYQHAVLFESHLVNMTLDCAPHVPYCCVCNLCSSTSILCNRWPGYSCASHGLKCCSAVQVQVVAAATGRRHLLRKDYGLTTASVPVHTVPPTSLSVAREATDRHTTDQLSRMQLAWASEVRAVRHRQLQQTCSAATSTTTFGDVNFDCQFTFVQVGNIQQQP